MELLFLIIFGAWIWAACRAEDKQFEKYDTRNVSIGKMTVYGQGKSHRQIRREMMQGKYDKDEQWKL